MAEYQPIPVQAAREIAERYAKQIVVIAAYDAPFERSHFATYGVSPEQKISAASAGERFKDLLLGEAAGAAAKRAAAIEQLIKAATAADYALGSVLAVREGASDELLEGVRQALQAAIAAGEEALRRMARDGRIRARRPAACGRRDARPRKMARMVRISRSH